MQSVTWISRKLRKSSDGVSSESTFYTDSTSNDSSPDITVTDRTEPSLKRSSSKFYVTLESSDSASDRQSLKCYSESDVNKAYNGSVSENILYDINETASDKITFTENTKPLTKSHTAGHIVDKIPNKDSPNNSPHNSLKHGGRKPPLKPKPVSIYKMEVGGMSEFSVKSRVSLKSETAVKCDTSVGSEGNAKSVTTDRHIASKPDIPCKPIITPKLGLNAINTGKSSTTVSDCGNTNNWKPSLNANSGHDTNSVSNGVSSDTICSISCVDSASSGVVSEKHRPCDQSDSLDNTLDLKLSSTNNVKSNLEDTSKNLNNSDLSRTKADRKVPQLLKRFKEMSVGSSGVIRDSRDTLYPQGTGTSSAKCGTSNSSSTPSLQVSENKMFGATVVRPGAAGKSSDGESGLSSCNSTCSSSTTCSSSSSSSCNSRGNSLKEVIANINTTSNTSSSISTSNNSNATNESSNATFSSSITIECNDKDNAVSKGISVDEIYKDRVDCSRGVTNIIININDSSDVGESSIDLNNCNVPTSDSNMPTSASSSVDQHNRNINSSENSGNNVNQKNASGVLYISGNSGVEDVMRNKTQLTVKAVRKSGHNRISFTTEDIDVGCFCSKAPRLPPPPLPRKPAPLLLREGAEESDVVEKKESDNDFRNRLCNRRSNSLTTSDVAGVPRSFSGTINAGSKPLVPVKPKFNISADSGISSLVDVASVVGYGGSKDSDSLPGTRSTLIARVSVTSEKDSVNDAKRAIWNSSEDKGKHSQRFTSIGSYSEMSRGGLIDPARVKSSFINASVKSNDIYVEEAVGDDDAIFSENVYEVIEFRGGADTTDSSPGARDGVEQDSIGVWSDGEEDDEEGSMSSDFTSEEESLYKDLADLQKRKSTKRRKRSQAREKQKVSKERKIAEEFLFTEKQYVEVLSLIDQVIHTQLLLRNREEKFLPDDVFPQIFSCIKSIYQFHEAFLLPQLEVCMEKWDSGHRIGTVLRKLAPCLVLYTDYVKNFDHANHVIVAWRSKSPKFAAVLDEIQRKPECKSLTLLNHMLGPIQRVPRYKLLLERYIESLTEENEDKKDAEIALALVSKAADHSNEAMRKIDKFRKLIEISELLGGRESIVSPTRELVREGPVIKISARDGTRIERYLFLFNDLLIVCQSLSLKITTKQQYVSKAQLDIAGMRVTKGDNPDTPNTFCIRSKQKAIEFHTSTSEENDEWQNTLWKTIAEFTKKTKSLQTYQENLMDDDALGKRAPEWIRDQETSMCMLCCLTFTTFKRRHHCRACGHVVCSYCSKQKMALMYDGNKENRVCDMCYNRLTNERMKNDIRVSSTEPTQASFSPDIRTKTSSLLRVKATDEAVISGYLQKSCDCKTWNRRFIAVHSNFVLYEFKAHKDMKAKSSIPLPGYQVEKVSDAGNSDQHQHSQLHVLRISHKNQPGATYLQTEDAGKLNRWMEALEKLVQAELPELKERACSSLASVSTPGIRSESSLVESLFDRTSCEEGGSQSPLSANIYDDVHV